MTYFVNTEKNIEKMLEVIGAKSMDELFDFIPEEIVDPEINLEKPLSEKSLKLKMSLTGKKNKPLDNYDSFLGGGAYNHYIPAAVKSILGISQFYTAYTPYQAEISQGTLQYIFEFQSIVCRLTGMDVANASMYDGASALAEAIIMAGRINGKKKVLLPVSVNPQYRATCKTYCEGINLEIIEIPYKDGQTDLDSLTKNLDKNVSSVVIQNPNFFGCFEDVFSLQKIIKKFPECLFIAVINPMSLGILRRPADYGADAVVGDGQVFGNNLAFGGPHLGFFATKQQYLRQMPGRIVGQTTESSGKKAYVLTFQAREQHIRKCKATSNICTNHSLNALAFLVYLSLAGQKGLNNIAETCLARAHYFAEKISGLKKFRLNFTSGFFNEFVLSHNLDLKYFMDTFYKNDILPGIPLNDYYPELEKSILVSVTEMNSIESIDKYIDILKKIRE